MPEMNVAVGAVTVPVATMMAKAESVAIWIMYCCAPVEPVQETVTLSLPPCRAALAATLVGSAGGTIGVPMGYAVKLEKPELADLTGKPGVRVSPTVLLADTR